MAGPYRYSFFFESSQSRGAAGGSLLLTLLMLFALWRIFTKAGEKGWKCLIPIYNLYMQWRIGWNTEKFWKVFTGSLIVFVFAGILSAFGETGRILIALLVIGWSVYTIYCTFKMAITMAHRFGKSTAFGVLGLVFFSIIGYPILAFGSADYDRARDED